MKQIFSIVMVVSAVSTGVFAGRPAAAGTEGYYTQPALHGDTLVFVSEGDLFTGTLAVGGGAGAGDQPIVAHRLTSGAGSEGRPIISPDGSTIAFSAQYDGNTDVFIMPIDGGAPQRLTFHPGRDVALGFSHDGRDVLFGSRRRNHFGRRELWKVRTDGGMPRPFGFGECSMAALNTSGKLVAFTQWSNEH